MMNSSTKSTSLYVETIRIEKGRVRNILYHNQRFCKTRRDLYGIDRSLNLRRFIHYRGPEDLIKCRILYREKIERIEYVPYELKPIKSLKIVETKCLHYPYKSTDRSEINKLFELKGRHDDIIILQNDLLTDSSYGNIALCYRNKWYTPSAPLLEGTMRARLIDKKVITPAPLDISDLSKCDHICLFNAMIPFGLMVLSSDQVFTE